MPHVDKEAIVDGLVQGGKSVDVPVEVTSDRFGSWGLHVHVLENGSNDGVNPPRGFLVGTCIDPSVENIEGEDNTIVELDGEERDVPLVEELGEGRAAGVRLDDIAKNLFV